MIQHPDPEKGCCARTPGPQARRLRVECAHVPEGRARRGSAANGARSEALCAKLRPRNNNGTLAQSSPVSPDTAPDNRARVQHAKAADTGEATLGRAFALHAARPDLHARVVAGDITLIAALRLKRRDDVRTKLAALPAKKFRVVYADPPWSYAGHHQGNGANLGYNGAAVDHYPAMSLQSICAIDVGSICCDNAVLFLWVPSPHLPSGLEVMRAWGFEYKASFVWDKCLHNLGYYNSVRHEFLLIATRGSCLPETDELIDSVQSIPRSKRHSEKPAAFRQIIDRLYPSGARLEMFVRGPLPVGWVGWGAEVSSPGAMTAGGGK